MTQGQPLSPTRRSGPGLDRRGFTIIELMTVLTVISALASIAVTRTQTTIDLARVARAIGDIRAIQIDIVGYQSAGQTLPAGLVDVGRDGLLDPWGRPYVYVNFSSGGSPRTDRFGVALNTEFDVYSLGADGGTAVSLSAGPSQDDVVRANDGGFIGKGAKF